MTVRATKKEQYGIVKYNTTATMMTDGNGIIVDCYIEDYTVSASVYAFCRNSVWSGVAIGNEEVKEFNGLPKIDDMRQMAFDLASAKWEAMNN